VSDFVKRFMEVDVGDYPDVHLLVEDLDVVLWILLVANERLSVQSMTAAEIAEVSTLGLRRSMTRQRVAGLLSAAKAIVAREQGSSPAQFVLMRSGADRIRGRRGDVVVIEPDAAFTGLLRLDEILSAVTGEVLLCDPYIDDKTLVALTSVPTTVRIKLLSLNVSDPTQFRRKLHAYDKQYGNLEIRVSPVADLHDRYLIDARRMLMIGQSLNGIGKKQTFIVAVGEDLRNSMEATFWKRWNSSVSWK